MDNKILNLKSKLWEKFHVTFWDYGGCSTCGPYATQVMYDDDFEKLLIEIDNWIDETYGTKV